MTAAPSRKFSAKSAMASLMLLGGLMVVALHQDFGVGWDDYVQIGYGQRVLDYFLSGGRDRACNDWFDLRYYGPPVELIGAAMARWIPADPIHLRHLLCGLISLLAIPAFYGWGRLLGRRWVGIVAALLLFAMPRFFGHAFINTKDMPFAVGMIASTVAMAGLFARARYTWREVIQCGLLVGVTVAIRPGGWLLLAPMYLSTAIFVDFQGWLLRRTHPETPKASRPMSRQLTMFAIAWMIMILVWPWAHESPLKNPWQAISASGKFHTVVPVLFQGNVIDSDALPRTYLLQFLWLTTPPALLLISGVGFIVAAARLLSGLTRRRAVVYWMMIVWCLLPIALFVVMRPNAYDGLRHFLFVLPALAFLAATGAVFCFTLRPGVWWKGIVTLAVLIGISPAIFDTVRLHPYQLAYFHRISGGVAGATHRFDTEYWLTSYREAMEWIAQQREDDRPIRVLVAANDKSKFCAEYYAPNGIEVVETLTGGQAGDVPPGFDYYMGTTRLGMADNFPDAATLKVISRMGAPFAVIKGASDDGSKHRGTETSQSERPGASRR